MTSTTNDEDSDFLNHSKYEIRDMLTTLHNQLYHLERSQAELQAALIEEPDDRDFTNAYNENIIIIENKKHQEQALKVRLKEIDPAYFIEQGYSLANNVALIPTIAGAGAVVSTNGECSNDTQFIPETNGVYL